MQTFVNLIIFWTITTVFWNCPQLIDGFILQPRNLWNVAAATATTRYEEVFVVQWKRDNKYWSMATNMILAASYHDDAFDIEAARQHLELLVTATTHDHSTTSLSSSGNKIIDYMDQNTEDFHDVMVSSQPLTTIERERRELEIKLLTDLAYGDDSIPKVWKLWFNERGTQAATRLYEADDYMNRGPDGWGKAQMILTDLVHEYGITWVEPNHRLATLYYLQGKYRAAEQMYRIVLQVKPWHFGALSGIVKIYAALHDTESARQWAALRLPTFILMGLNRRRNQWVHHAVEQANIKLRSLEDTLRNSFGNQDEHVINRNSDWESSSTVSIESSQWQ